MLDQQQQDWENEGGALVDYGTSPLGGLTENYSASLTESPWDDPESWSE